MEVGCAILSVKPRPYVSIVLGEAMELEDTENNENCDWEFLNLQKESSDGAPLFFNLIN